MRDEFWTTLLSNQPNAILLDGHFGPAGHCIAMLAGQSAAAGSSLDSCMSTQLQSMFFKVPVQHCKPLDIIVEEKALLSCLISILSHGPYLLI